MLAAGRVAEDDVDVEPVVVVVVVVVVVAAAKEVVVFEEIEPTVLHSLESWDEILELPKSLEMVHHCSGSATV